MVELLLEALLLGVVLLRLFDRNAVVLGDFVQFFQARTELLQLSKLLVAQFLGFQVFFFQFLELLSQVS